MSAGLVSIILFALAAAPRDDGRAEGAVDEVARQAEPTADPVRRNARSLRFQGAERAAVERCAPQVERFGRMRIDEVVRDGRGGWRVEGTVAGAAIGDTNGWRRGFVPRAFTCTVGGDGRVKLKTSRLRR
jgi:hypothetical protein